MSSKTVNSPVPKALAEANTENEDITTEMPDTTTTTTTIDTKEITEEDSEMVDAEIETEAEITEIADIDAIVCDDDNDIDENLSEEVVAEEIDATEVKETIVEINIEDAQATATEAAENYLEHETEALATEPKEMEVEEEEEELTATNKTRIVLIRGRKSIKDVKDVKDVEETPTEAATVAADIEKDKIEITLEAEDEIEGKKEHIEEAAANTNIIGATARTTRKSAAQETLVASTRVTRNRQQTQPDTPPSNSATRPRRSAATRKVAESSPTMAKRRRLADDLAETLAINVKHIKVEEKEESELGDEEPTEIEVKQEILESDESAASTSTINSRARARGRKSQTPTISSSTASPSTRTTRNTKLSAQSTSPSASPSLDCKRKRIMTLSIKRTNMTKIKLEKEDVAKVEKHSADELELDEIEAENKINGIEEPLSVDTAAGVARAVSTGAVEETEIASTSGGQSSSGSEKAASLSPDMVSEGVNVISVKQFYKKPKFLENNLGIEEDPKLGGIVQKVTTNPNEEHEVDVEEVEDMDEFKLCINEDEELAEHNKLETLDSVVVESVEIAAEENTKLKPDDEETSACCGDDEEMQDLEAKVAEEEEEEETVEATLVIEEEEHNNNEKTKIDCDNNKAKLEDEHKQEIGIKKRQKKQNEQEKVIGSEQNKKKENKLIGRFEAEIHKVKVEAEAETAEADKENQVKIEKVSKDEVSTTVHTPEKAQSAKDEDVTSVKSDSNSWPTLDMEYDEEKLRLQEQHLQNLGLLTHKAAEKRRQEYIQSSAAAVEAATQQQRSNKRGSKNTLSATVATPSSEYTGTLKTVIKLNRNSTVATAATNTSNTNGNARKGQNVSKEHVGNGNGNVRRQPLKMTFQKGRGRGQGNSDRSNNAQSHEEDAYYTIQNEVK